MRYKTGTAILQDRHFVVPMETEKSRKSIKNPPRNTGVIIKNKVVRFFVDHCVAETICHYRATPALNPTLSPAAIPSTPRDC